MIRQNGKTRTADEMREVISAQQESGKSIKAFCRDNGIGIWIFGYWKKRLRELDNKLPLKSKFTQVKVSKDCPRQVSPSAAIKVKIDEKYELSVPADFDRSHLESVILVLQSC